ncbi:uncharacterized protein LOC132037913 [Lycium ferocissimum]|uniref:uncharacterized protein LOC132037913 n=1 Tax=Lycium ferocissimum TaxID=112874 RepID=UPI0028159630|nr:uncharacterized protein LOC132037913 [Lycium ferocissimum]
MARTNKYTSLNFNDIYEKKTKPTSRPNSSSSSSSSSNNKTIISNSRIHGHMLVLSRPTPKPISVPQPEPGPIHQQQPNKLQSPLRDQKTRAEPESDSISLRPQGRTGSGSGQAIVSSSPLQSPLQKSSRFVPPHLRPGFVGREEKPVPGQGVRGRPEVVGPGPGPGIHQHHHNQGNRENGRPKSGGGYERMNRDSVNFMNRPRSSGARPSSSG